jgi:hypothetical protein
MNSLRGRAYDAIKDTLRSEQWMQRSLARQVKNARISFVQARLVVVSLAHELSPVDARLGQLAAAVAQKVEHQPKPARVPVYKHPPLHAAHTVILPLSPARAWHAAQTLVWAGAGDTSKTKRYLSLGASSEQHKLVAAWACCRAPEPPSQA